MSTNRCICCGDEIPEGRIVCWRCEHSQPELDDAKGENTMSKDEIIRKLTSRKLWMAVAGFVSGLLIYFGQTAEQAERVAALILSGASVLAFVLGEGLIDAAREKGDTYIIPDDEAHPPEK